MENDTPKDEFKILIVAAHTDPIVSRFKEAVESMKRCSRIRNFQIELIHPNLNDITVPRDGSVKFKTLEHMLAAHNYTYNTLGGHLEFIPRSERVPHRQRADKRKYPH